MNEVKQIGNYETNSIWDNPQTGRVYAVSGLSPTLNTCGGGGHEVKIMELGKINSSQDGTVVSIDGLAKTLTSGHNNQPKILEPIIVASRGRNKENPSDRTTGNEVEQRLEPNSQGICNTLTSVQKDNLVLEPAVRIKQATKEGYIECKLGGVADLSYPQSKTRRGRVQDNGDTCPTLTATETGVCRIETPYRIRKLTPRECWRLMDFSDLDFFSAMLQDREAATRLMEKYKDNLNGIAIMREAETMQKTSNTQLYKEAGNSIVKAVLMGIFRPMF